MNNFLLCNKYINYKNFTITSTKHTVPKGTVCYCNEDGMISIPNTITGELINNVLYYKSENTYMYFIPLIDDLWEERSKLMVSILSLFEQNPKNNDKLFSILENDDNCTPFRLLSNEEDHYSWRWNRHRLHYATLDELKYLNKILHSLDK